MVDAHHQSQNRHEKDEANVVKLLQWLSTFKGFHNKLDLKAADGEWPRPWALT